MQRKLTILMVLLLLAGTLWAAVPVLVDPTVVEPKRGYAQVGDVIGPITANGVTLAVFRFKDVKDDHRVAMQIFDDDTNWDGAQVTGQMRICVDATASLECPFVDMPNTAWPVTDDGSGLIGSIQSYGPETEFRLSVATVGAGTSLYFVMRQ